MNPPYDDFSSTRSIPEPADGPPKWREAWLYHPTDQLVAALRLALKLRQPLLLTGEPGCGKTSAAYWAAMNLGLSHEDLVHDTVRSDASAQRLRYEFDAVRYFRLAQVHKEEEPDPLLCIKEGPLWRAFKRAATRRTVLLLDEIDKAPRDFPNDLLHEFDTLEFDVPELYDRRSDKHYTVSARNAPKQHGLMLLVVTSNGERQFPDAFLRRCLHHHLEIGKDAFARLVEDRIKKGDLAVGEGVRRLAVEMFVELRRRKDLEHPVGPAELLVWLRAVSLLGGVSEAHLQRLDVAKLPHLEALFKTPGDLLRVRGA